MLSGKLQQSQRSISSKSWLFFLPIHFSHLRESFIQHNYFHTIIYLRGAIMNDLLSTAIFNGQMSEWEMKKKKSGIKEIKEL